MKVEMSTFVDILKVEIPKTTIPIEKKGNTEG
jgi:hypothetical protein